MISWKQKVKLNSVILNFFSVICFKSFITIRKLSLCSFFSCHIVSNIIPEHWEVGETSHQCESHLSWGDEHLGDQPQWVLKFTFQRALPVFDKVSKAGDVYRDLEGRSCSLTQFQEVGVFWQCSNDRLSQCVTLNYDTTLVCAKKIGFDLSIRPGFWTVSGYFLGWKKALCQTRFKSLLSSIHFKTMIRDSVPQAFFAPCEPEVTECNSTWEL